jgi:hypothetical protein
MIVNSFRSDAEVKVRSNVRSCQAGLPGHRPQADGDPGPERTSSPGAGPGRGAPGRPTGDRSRASAGSGITMRLAVYRKLLTTYVMRAQYASTGCVKARIKEQSQVNVAGASRGPKGLAQPCSASTTSASTALASTASVDGTGRDTVPLLAGDVVTVRQREPAVPSTRRASSMTAVADSGRCG